MDFVGKRYWFWLLSLIVILPGIAFLIMAPGLKRGIDFTGGSSLTIQFTDPVQQGALRQELAVLGHPSAIVQSQGNNTFFIRTREVTDEERNRLEAGLRSSLSPGGVEVLSFDQVSPTIAAETVRYGFYAVLAATLGIFFYLWWAFRNVPSPFRYGAAAVVALVHDTIVVVGVFAILGVLADIEVNTPFLIALLTVIGYSVNDTIVVFDKLRENVLLYPNRPLADNVNLSIAETMSRSINTSVTLLITVLALYLFGGATLREFLLVLMAGIVAGTYSSIGIAASLLVAWENGDFGRLFRRGRAARTAVPATS